MINLIEKTRLGLIKKGKKILNLSSGNANEHGIFFPQKILQEAFGNFLKNPEYQPDPKGEVKARKAVQLFYQKRGLNILPDQIILTSGTSESYFHLFKLLAGDTAAQSTIASRTSAAGEILFPNPAYPLFEEIARLSGTRIKFYRLDENNGWQIDLKDLQNKITKNTKAIVLISPNNPTGSVLSAATVKQVLKLASQKNIAIISDEVFSEFIFDATFPRAAASSRAAAFPITATSSHAAAYPRAAQIAAQNNITNIPVFTLNGVSKTYALPGLKISWIIVTGSDYPKYIDLLERPVDALLACNQIGQAMLPTVIKKGEPFIKKLRRYLQNNQKLAIQILKKEPRITYHRPEGGFYLFAKINPRQTAALKTSPQTLKAPPQNKKTSLTDEQFVIKLMQKTGIFAHPGYFYDYDRDLYILISLLLPPKILQKSLQKIIDFIKSLEKFNLD